MATHEPPAPPTEELPPPTDESPAPPPPEPMTPERALGWDRYYDRYLAAGVVLLAILGATYLIPSSDASFWSLLRAGQFTASTGRPLLDDRFTYSQPGASWANIPWVFEGANYLLFLLGRQINIANDAARSDQFGAGAIILFNALVRGLTAWMLLRLRRPGPGLWWTALVVMLAVGGLPVPGRDLAALDVGGLAGRAVVSPETWGLFLLAGELVLLHRATDLGRPRALYALPPLFLVWANVDESFVFGLLILAASVVGALAGRRRAGAPAAEPGLSPAQGLGVLAACVVACLVNPSVHRALIAAAAPYVQVDLFLPSNYGLPLTGDQLSIFGRRSRDLFAQRGQWGVTVGEYLVFAGIGLASFALNRARFAPARFAMYALATLLWGMGTRLTAEFALVWAAAVALNGQEWYHTVFGTRGRIETGWRLWAVGGRSLTIVLLFAFCFRAVSGYAGQAGLEPIFGLGYSGDDFAFEAAEYLRTAGFEGRVLNLTLAHGDALNWRALPRRRPYIDGRKGLFPVAFRREHIELRDALRQDRAARWKPILDRFGVVAVMLDARRGDSRLYEAMVASRDWVLFYNDGQAALFGRTDAPAADLAYFRGHQVEAQGMVFRRRAENPLLNRGPERPPTPSTWIDRVVQHRALRLPQPHVSIAAGWLERPETTPPDPARCLMAVREARVALVANPDDSYALRVLNDAYRELSLAEVRILQARPSGNPQSYIQFRFRQRASALYYAIQTYPPPRDDEDRGILGEMNVQLAQMYLSNNDYDVGLDHLRRARELVPRFSEADLRRLAQLEEMVEARLHELEDEAGQQPIPLPTKAQRAAVSGLPGAAIRFLEDAESEGTNPAVVRPLLVDLYCRTGQPDRAYDILLQLANVDDPSIASGPGTGAYRQATVNLLLGYYDNAIALFRDRAIPALRGSTAAETLAAARELLRGGVRAAAGEQGALLNVPSRLATVAEWESELGLTLLEAGDPPAAADHFTRALTAEPDFALRPLLSFYLEKLGKPVPPPSKRGEEASK